MNMNYLVGGDIHNRLAEFKASLDQAIVSHNIKFGLSVGDYGFFIDRKIIWKVDPKTMTKNPGRELELTDLSAPNYSIPVYTVPGNHEDQEFLDDAYVNGVYQLHNLFFLHGAFKKIQEHLYVFGLGKIYVDTTYRLYSKEYLNRYGLRNDRKGYSKWIKRRNHITKEELSFALNNIKEFNKTRDWNKDKIIAVFHDAPPHFKGHIPCGSAIISDLLNLIAPDKAYFGHYHYAMQFGDNEFALNKHEIRIETIDDGINEIQKENDNKKEVSDSSLSNENGSSFRQDQSDVEQDSITKNSGRTEFS